MVFVEKTNWDFVSKIKLQSSLFQIIWECIEKRYVNDICSILKFHEFDLFGYLFQRFIKLDLIAIHQSLIFGSFQLRFGQYNSFYFNITASTSTTASVLRFVMSRVYLQREIRNLRFLESHVSICWYVPFNVLHIRLIHLI